MLTWQELPLFTAECHFGGSRYGDMVPDNLAESNRSFGARSRRQDTTWQGFRTEQEEQKVS